MPNPITVHKFGGGVLRDAAAIRKLCEIVHAERPNVIVVSALGKTTKALEAIFQQSVAGQDYTEAVEALCAFHQDLMAQLFAGEEALSATMLAALRQELVETLASAPRLASTDELYSAVVSWGELIAVQIVQRSLQKTLGPHEVSRGEYVWLDARSYIVTQGEMCNAQIDWPATEAAATTTFTRHIAAGRCVLIQGFVGRHAAATTTLGKEGSDFTAAVMAALLGAAGVTIWKDVPGVMSADPRIFKDARLLDQLSYCDLAEMAFYGAKVVHARTLQPLAAHGIPLYVKSFHNPQAPGTVVTDQVPASPQPFYVLKEDQCLLKLCLPGLQLFEEKHCEQLFAELHRHGMQANCLVRGAHSLVACLPQDVCKSASLLAALDQQFEVQCQAPVSLLTAVYALDEAARELLQGSTILMTQQCQEIYQVVFQAAAP